jgi:HJR/Mrr/RecB family endonuclease
LERTAKESDSLVDEKVIKTIVYDPKYYGAREIP